MFCMFLNDAGVAFVHFNDRTRGHREKCNTTFVWLHHNDCNDCRDRHWLRYLLRPTLYHKQSLVFFLRCFRLGIEWLLWLPLVWSLTSWCLFLLNHQGIHHGQITSKLEGLAFWLLAIFAYWQPSSGASCDHPLPIIISIVAIMSELLVRPKK